MDDSGQLIGCCVIRLDLEAQQRQRQEKVNRFRRRKVLQLDVKSHRDSASKPHADDELKVGTGRKLSCLLHCVVSEQTVMAVLVYCNYYCVCVTFLFYSICLTF